LITRLASHDWFTSRISACSLFAAAIPKVSDSNQEDLMKIYIRLCSDETPMVRRQAAQVLGEVAAVAPQDSMLTEIVEVFEKLSRDEQESVRILAINNCVALGKLRSSAEWQAQIFPVVKSCAQDKSWRVRYVMAENVHPLCDVFQADIVPLHLDLLQDWEVEVRTIAAAKIAAVSKIKPDKEFLETLMPAMEKLTAPKERSQHVRAALAGSVLSLTPIFGPKLTVDYLISIFLQLIRDENPEVRLKLIGTLGDLSSVMGLDVLSQSLLPCIKELGRDRQWRVRLSVIDNMPSLAKCLGEEQFTEELSNLFAVWLEDPVFSVRDAVAHIFRRLYEVLGLSWCETHIIPRLQAMLAHGNYLYRISAVLCAGRLAEVAAGAFLEKQLVPLVVKMAADPVPNVRFNAAKTIQAMRPFAAKSNPAVAEGSLLPCLRRQLDDQDPDVKFFARRALEP
jgi:serine/threonine-protein phosphatase 2A regulatory subunit A